MNETMADTMNPSATMSQCSGGAPATGWWRALKIFNPLAASMVGIPTRKENSVAAGRFNPKSRQKRMVAPDREVPGEHCRQELAYPHRHGDGPGDVVLECSSAQPGFDGHKPDAPYQQGDGDRLKILRELQPLLLQDEARNTSDHAGEDNLERIKLRLLAAPFEEELVQAMGKQRQHSEHRAGLDDHVEEIGLMAVEPFLGDQEVPGG